MLLQLLPTADAPRRARAHVVRHLDGLLEGRDLDDAVLLASELVVVCLLAEDATPGRRISVDLLPGGGEVVCRVSDVGGGRGADGAAWPTDGPEADPRFTLVDLLSSGWGVDAVRPATVWFSIRRTRPDGPS